MSDELFNSFGSGRIAVIGDLMLDVYLWGQVSRISPEAPVPIVNVKKREARLGGAANVMRNLGTLGAGRVYAFGAAGTTARERNSKVCSGKRGSVPTAW